MKDMKITFSDESRNFSGWFHEKSSNVLCELCNTIKDHPEIVKNASFCFALEDSLKLYGLAHENINGLYKKEVIKLLIQYHIDGYDFLEDILNGTMYGKLMKSIYCEKIDDRIMELIEQNDKSNRTEIAVLLAKMKEKNQWAKQITDDIERVHQGEKDWNWFYNRHCNDKNTVKSHFNDSFIKGIYDYFKSDEFLNADVMRSQ